MSSGGTPHCQDLAIRRTQVNAEGCYQPQSLQPQAVPLPQQPAGLRINRAIGFVKDGTRGMIDKAYALVFAMLLTAMQAAPSSSDISVKSSVGCML